MIPGMIHEHFVRALCLAALAVYREAQCSLTESGVRRLWKESFYSAMTL